MTELVQSRRHLLLFWVFWGCAFVVLFIATTKDVSAVPAVSGYSNTRKSESTTVGIVIGLKGGAFSYKSKKCQDVILLNVGSGVFKSHAIWVEPLSELRLLTTKNTEVVIAGPAITEFDQEGRLKVIRGSFYIQTNAFQDQGFENPYLAGNVKGSAVLWAYKGSIQLLSISGLVDAWHPLLREGIVHVPVYHYTESFINKKYLHPRKPQLVDVEKSQEYLSLFGIQLHIKPELLSEQDRKIASEESESFEKGSRSSADILEPENQKAIKFLEAHIAGRDFEEEDNEEEKPFLVVPGQKLKGKGRHLASSSSKLASSKRPYFEVMEVASKPTEEQSEFLKALLNRKGVKKGFK